MQGLILVWGKTTPSVEIGKISTGGRGEQRAEATWLKFEFQHFITIKSTHISNADCSHYLHI